MAAAVTAMLAIAPASSAGASTGWSIVPSPNASIGANFLSGVSCATAQSCQAVGYSYDATTGVARALTESRTAAGWSLVPGANAGSGANQLLGISCISDRSCTGVGFYDAGGTNNTLIESWNGRSWSVVPSPNRESANNILSTVSCASRQWCTAVGYSYDTNNPVFRVLVESWDGTNWSIAAAPNQGEEANILSGVSCLSRVWCTAVGYYNALGVVRTLVESWNGTTWSVVPSPNNGTFDNSLVSVSCVSSRSCQAVGEYGTPNFTTDQTLIEAWNGASWSIVPSPNTGNDIDFFDGVSCRGAGSCTAVGTFFEDQLSAYRTLVESWDGQGWSIVPSPNNDSALNSLVGVSCITGRPRCTAVGYSSDAAAGNYRTLVAVSG